MPTPIPLPLSTAPPPPPRPPQNQANGVFAFGVYVGGGLSSLSIALAKVVGWRGSAYTVAGYGLLLSLLVRFTVREPARTPAVVPLPAGRADGDVGVGNGPAAGEEEGDKDYTVTQRSVEFSVFACCRRCFFVVPWCLSSRSFCG